MKIRFSTLALAVATMLGTLSALPAQALTITTSSAPFGSSATVIDNEGGGATTNSNVALGISAISQFDPFLGVLTSATLNLTSTRIQTTQVTSTSGGPFSLTPVTSNGTGSSNAKIAAPGVTNTFSLISVLDSCLGLRSFICIGLPTISAPVVTNLTGAVAVSNLDNYVGSSTVNVTRTATLTATQSNNVFNGLEQTTSNLAWAGGVSATYNYLLHADPSFDGSSSALILDLNFGTVFLGAATPSLNFSIFNRSATDRVGLDLDSFDPFAGPFSTNLSTFSNLSQGTSNSYSVFFDTSSLGVYNASYTLNLSDTDVGASRSRNDFSLTLNLIGTVATPIPEPDALALLGIGLLGLGFARRKT